MDWFFFYKNFVLIFLGLIPILILWIQDDDSPLTDACNIWICFLGLFISVTECQNLIFYFTSLQIRTYQWHRYTFRTHFQNQLAMMVIYLVVSATLIFVMFFQTIEAICSVNEKSAAFIDTYANNVTDLCSHGIVKD